MSKFESILKSFHSKDHLNEKIWKENKNGIIINPNVRKKLLEISNEFIEFLKVDVIVSDIIMTGSLANYNWSEFSDIDLHIIIDFEQFSEEQLPLYEELFRLKKTLFNEKHNIRIFGYEVELYVQNESESHFSSGVFSVLNDEWIVEPKKENVKIDTGLIKNKAEQWMRIIDGVIENASDEPLDEAKKIISKYKDKLKKYRTCGLESGGEYSDENLVFKILRRNNYIQKLFDFEVEMEDKELSLKEYMEKKHMELLKEGSKDELDSKILKSLQSIESTYGVTITDENINDELSQEKQFYPDNSGINSTALKNLKELLKNLYSVFPNAPVDSNSNCDGVQGCVSGYRGYSTQVKTFGSKIKRDGGVSNRQKLSALPGFSQHHTGKAFDILSVESQWWNKNSKIKTWVENNVCKYGFKVSYLTQGVLRSAEPWHLYFTGEFCEKEQVDNKTLDNGKEKVDSKTSVIKKETPSEDSLVGDLNNFVKSNRILVNQKKQGERISYNEEVQNLQKGLQFLQYSLAKWGADGKFGNETEKALIKFETDNGLNVDGKFDSVDAQVLIKKLNEKGFKTSDEKVLQITPTEKEIKTFETDDDEYVVLAPENYQGKNVHVLFGGSHTSGYSRGSHNPESIKKYANIMAPYATNTMIVVTHHMNTVSNVQKYVSEKYGANVVSLAGFSQGGKEAWRHASDSSYRLVGLIDPSTYEINVQFGSGTYLYCDPKNWGTTGFYGKTREKLEWYCDNKEKYSGHVTCFNKGGWHMNFGILKSFYDTYVSMI